MTNSMDEAEDIGELSEFFREAWPLDEKSSRPEVIAWRYRSGFPDRDFRGRHFVWRVNGRIVAHLGALPVDLDGGSHSRRAAWLFDWMTLPEHRGSRGGMRIMNAALDSFPFAMAVGLTEASESIFRRSGWRDAGLVERQVRLLNPAPFLPEKFGIVGRAPGVARASRIAAEFIAAGGALFTTSEASGKGRILEFTTTAEFPAGEAVRLFEEAVNPAFVRVRRDSHYLAARYASSPPWPTRHILVREKGEIEAWAAWSRKERSDGAVVGRLLEFWNPAVDQFIEERLLGRVVEEMKAANVDLAEVTSRNLISPLSLKRNGFRPRRGLQLMWKGEGLSQSESLAAHWLLSAGDSDQDR